MVRQDQEYNNILTLTTQTLLPPAHSFIPIWLYDTVNLCHQLTLAQGRILYNVYDSYERSDHVGIVIPSHILGEVETLTKQSLTEQWRHRSAIDRENLDRSHSLVLEHFPRMPGIGAQKVAMRLALAGRSPSTSAVEEAVVQYALLYWTSYRLRLEQAQATETWRAIQDAREAVQSSLRAILTSWLPLEMTGREQLAFCRVHDLLEREEAAILRGVELTYLGGKETVANFAFR
ncbi:hypothetical protein B0A48_01137 [Cryoendolithus antarcticus]|uniref:Uncharacterized protein n=1 Tax=Cryoendolithus antarcticus TaxID=1507870 RepID=A0A1V8TSK0_9PEZI|nr:hypothetical protein B0A48_01137 [Cryoendolithus antarcticus]